MRIAKVALAFFSVGFVAGSLECAAGLGDAKGVGRAHRGFTDPDAAIARSATLAMAAVTASIGTGLPDDLLARPLIPPGRVPDAAAAVLPDLSTQPVESAPATPAHHAPQGTVQGPPAGVFAIDPGSRRPAFGAKRMLSEPDQPPMSKAPSPKWVSVAPAEAPVPVPAPSPGPALGSKRVDAPEAIAREFIMPFASGRVTSLFNQGRYHPAIDLAGPLGTPVRATTRRQRVVFTGWRGGYGNTVMTRDDRGRTHLYAHLQRIGTRVGRLLEQGQTLGALGSTGRSTGPHVHYEVRAGSGRHINPVALLFPGRRVARGYAWRNARPPADLAERALVAGYPRPR
jgi:murein DD-endopeptidase MepM/ murein hydrolase activator NlpD